MSGFIGEAADSFVNIVKFVRQSISNAFGDIKSREMCLSLPLFKIEVSTFVCGTIFLAHFYISLAIGLSVCICSGIHKFLQEIYARFSRLFQCLTHFF